AVQTEQGLVVPVVRDCDSRSPDELDDEVKRLADAAQNGKLAPEELRGGTFTVTSAGKSAGFLTTPLINHPQVAIFGVYRIAEPLRDVGALVDVDLLHAQRASLLAGDVREQALHAPRRAGAAGREEDE